MLKQQIQKSTNDALKGGNRFLAETLRMVLASILSKEKEKRYKLSKERPDLKEEDLVKEAQLTEEQEIEIISLEIKKRKDAAVLYEQGNRQELADKEREEIDILKVYLPEQLSEEELKSLIQESIQKIGARGIKDMGKIMIDLAPKTKGKADNAEVSKIVREIITK